MLLRILFKKSGGVPYFGKFCLMITSLALISIHLQAQNGWTQKADMITPRGGASASVVGDKIFVVGGSGTNLIDLDANEMYDPSTNVWVPEQSMPTPRGFLFSAAGYNHRGCRPHHHQADDHGIVAVDRTGHPEFSQSGHAKDGLDKDRAGDQVGDNGNHDR